MVEVVCEDCGERQRIGIFDATECERCGSDRLRATDESDKSEGREESDGSVECERSEESGAPEKSGEE